MKAYSLLYLSLFSFAALSACKPSAAAQAKKIKEMEKKELKMLKEAKPEISESEGDTIEDYYGTSREGLINWVLTDTATLSYPFTRSIEKKICHHCHLRRQPPAHLFMEHRSGRNHDSLGQPHPVQKRR